MSSKFKFAVLGIAAIMAIATPALAAKRGAGMNAAHARASKIYDRAPSPDGTDLYDTRSGDPPLTIDDPALTGGGSVGFNEFERKHW